jgi:hypothetical protein
LPLSLQTQTHSRHKDSSCSTAHHGNDGAAADVVNKATEERLAGQVCIVLLCQGALNVHELQALQCVAALLKALDDVTNEATLNAVRLQGQQQNAQTSELTLRPPSDLELPNYPHHLDTHPR